MPLAGSIAIAVWLGLSSSPLDRRMGRINAVFEQGALGQLEPRLQRQLDEQVRWLARHAGIGGRVEVNRGIALDRLDVMVTRAEYQHLTGCGRGNAIYDRALDAIFVDEYLLRPMDLPHLGNKGPITMYSVDEADFLVPSLSFVLAHEMGHRQAGDAAAAFFAADWLRFGGEATEQELAADRFAIRTLMRAYVDPRVPEFVIEKNALSFAGIVDEARLSPRERAAADVLGAMVGMSLVMQFAAGPYSPFFRDAVHPSFVERAADAVARVSGDAGLVRNQAPLVAEIVRRTRALPGWSYSEIRTPYPIARVVVRNGTVWMGARELFPAGLKASDPQPGPLRERLYRLDRGSGRSECVLVKEGPLWPSGSSSWLDSLFEEGDDACGLPPAPKPPVRTVRRFRPFTKWKKDGLAYDGDGWVWMEGSAERGVAVRELEVIAKELLQAERVELGRPQLRRKTLLVPVRSCGTAADSRLRVLALANGRVGIAEKPIDPNFRPEAGWIDVEGVLRVPGAWLVPGRLHRAEEHYRWRVWLLEDAAAPRLAGEGRFLASFIGPAGDRAFGRDLDPSETRMLSIGGGMYLLWFDGDSVWLLGAEQPRIALHPASKDLRVESLGNGTALFWIENASKIYLLNFIQ